MLFNILTLTNIWFRVLDCNMVKEHTWITRFTYIWL